MISHSVSSSLQLRGRAAAAAAERLSLCCHPSLKHTALSSSPDSPATHSDTHSLPNTAWLPPLLPPSSHYHHHSQDIALSRPSQLRPFVTSNKVALSPQSAARCSFPTPSLFLLLANIQLCISQGVNKFPHSLSAILMPALCLTTQKEDVLGSVFLLCSSTPQHEKLSWEHQ